MTLQILFNLTIIFFLITLNKKANLQMATQAEQTAKLTAIADKLDKAKTEIIAAVQALKDAQAASGNTTPEEDAATNRLDAVAQALDDLNPDATPPTA